MYDKAFILESLFGPKELSENSIIGFDPEYTISCDSKKFAISDRKEKIQEFEVTNPLHQLRRLVPRVTDNRFRYLGGAVGYISYDAIRFWHAKDEGFMGRKPLAPKGFLPDDFADLR